MTELKRRDAMRWLRLLWLFCLLPGTAAALDFPRFETQEIDAGLKIGYAVITVDIDGDGRLDIVVVDQHQVVWYRNPGQRHADWTKFVILDGQSQSDNVCIAAVDILNDGQPELVLGAGWRPFETAAPGQLLWLQRGSDVTQPWTMHHLPCEEPMVHRVRVFDIDGDGRPEIVHVPLMGRGATRDGNWLDGRPLRVIALPIPDSHPQDPDQWQVQVLSDQLHVAHNFFEGPSDDLPRPGRSILTASYLGVSLILPAAEAQTWNTVLLHPAHQENPAGSRGASEIKQSQDGRGVIATIEPWHGNQVVVYTPTTTTSLNRWAAEQVAAQQAAAKSQSNEAPDQAATVWPLQRHVLDKELRWGHGVAFADLTGDGFQELVIGVRDDPNPNLGDAFTTRRGVRLYRPRDPDGHDWERWILDDGGVAVEDLTVADLDGDGRVDIIAVGRQTGNARIYWNVAPQD